MKRKLLFIAVVTIVVAGWIGFWALKDRSVNKSRLSELRSYSSETSKLLGLGDPLQRLESDRGYYKLKGNEHYSWSVRDSFNLSDISLAKIEAIDLAMVKQRWQRKPGVKSTLSENYSWAEKWYNSYDLTYIKQSKPLTVCQRFSFWWKAQPIDNGTVNTFLFSEFTDYCS